MYVILDSNIWLPELGLNTPRGAAARFFLKHSGAKLAVPEVVRIEVETNLIQSLSSFTSEITKNHRQLLTVFGQLKEVVLPSQDQIIEQVKSMFKDIRVEITEIPFSLESARASLEKIFAKVAPNGLNNQQFKDGVIWADCMHLLTYSDVSLVTEDKAFFRDRQYEKGLADNLRQEVELCPYRFNIFSSLNELIGEIGASVEIDESELVRIFTTESAKSIANMLERNGFAISSSPKVRVSPYVTENPDRLYIDFQITYGCNDSREEGRTNAILTLKGDAFYSTNNKEFSELRNRGEELSFDDGGEERKSINHVLLAGNIVLGHRTVEHTIRHPIS